MRITRRRAATLMAAAPAAVALAAAQESPQASPFASCIAAAETSLGPEERQRLQKAIAGLEGSLQAVRDFRVPADAAPAMHFRPMSSRQR